MKLLTVNNPKTAKGEHKKYLTGILHLAPYKLSGYNVCPMAEIAGCAKACLNTAGRGGMGVTVDSILDGSKLNVVQRARIRKTKLFMENRNEFMIQLRLDIEELKRKAKKSGLIPAVRLNGTSDIRWEDIPYRTASNDHDHSWGNIFQVCPDVQFYDYTKIPNRLRALEIPNYHLTFSYSGIPAFQPFVHKAVTNYGDKVNLAIVVDDPQKFSQETWGKPIINGDEHDLRFLDKPGHVVLLKAKGPAKKDTSGFVVRS